MIGNSVAANAPIKALSMIPHMTKEQLEMYARDTSSPLSTFAIARLNAMQIAATKANAGIGPKSTVAQQVLAKENTMVPTQGIQQLNPQFQPQVQQLAQAQTDQVPVQMAEGGVAGLDTGDMYKEDSFATGGIIAFSGKEGSTVEGGAWVNGQWLSKDEEGDKIRAKLEKMSKKADLQEDINPWMALTQAGLSMAAGKSQFALQNIAEGGASGLKAYGDAQDKLEATRLKQMDIQNQLAKAKRAERISAVTEGIKSKQHIEDANHATSLAAINSKLEVAKTNQTNLINAFEAGPKAQYYTAEAEKAKAEANLSNALAASGGGKGALTQEQIQKRYDNYRKNLDYKDYPKGLSVAEFTQRMLKGNVGASAAASFTIDPKNPNVWNYKPQ